MLRIVDSPFCPLSAYLRMVRLVPARRSSAVFLISGPTGLAPLTKRSFVSNFRSCLVAAGISNAQSLRVILFDEEQPRGPLAVAFLGS